MLICSCVSVHKSLNRLMTYSLIVLLLVFFFLFLVLSPFPFPIKNFIQKFCCVVQCTAIIAICYNSHNFCLYRGFFLFFINPCFIRMLEVWSNTLYSWLLVHCIPFFLCAVFKIWKLQGAESLLIFSMKQLERGLHGLEPVVVATFPTKKFSDEFLSSGDDAQ